MQKKTVDQLICELIKQGLSDQEAWWLLEKLFQRTKIELILAPEINFTDHDQAQLDIWVYQITQEYKPIQYILGEVNFLGLQILVAPPILIPRPETEAWCAVVIKQLLTGAIKLDHQSSDDKNSGQSKLKLKILDLCAGTGCIGLALAQALPDSQVYAVDISPQACELIEKNKLINQINNLTVINCDLNNLDLLILSDIDLIVANPPYITATEYLDLAPNVREWEDPQALVSGVEGLDLIKNIIALAAQANIKFLYLEIGFAQAAAVTVLAQAAGFQQIIIHRDMYGKNRMLEMRLFKD